MRLQPRAVETTNVSDETRSSIHQGTRDTRPRQPRPRVVGDDVASGVVEVGIDIGIHIDTRLHIHVPGYLNVQQYYTNSTVTLGKVETLCAHGNNMLTIRHLC